MKNKELINQMLVDYCDKFGVVINAGNLAKFSDDLLARRRGQWVLDQLDKSFPEVSTLVEFRNECDAVNHEEFKNKYLDQFRAMVSAKDVDQARVLANSHLVKYLSPEELQGVAKELGDNYLFAEGMILTQKEHEILTKAAQKK